MAPTTRCPGRATARRCVHRVSSVRAHLRRIACALWRDYEAARSRCRTGGPRWSATLTHHGFIVVDRASPAGVRDVPLPRFSIRRHSPRLSRLHRPGARRVRARASRLRYLGSTWLPAAGHDYFDQLELRRNAGLYSDLYTARSIEPTRYTLDVRKPDSAIPIFRGRTTLVCVRTAPAVGISCSSRTVQPRTWRPASAGLQMWCRTFRTVAQAITTLISEPDTQFNTPRGRPTPDDCVERTFRVANPKS